MDDTLLFYVVISTTHVLPLTFNTLCLVYGVPFPFLTNIMSKLSPTNRALRNTGIARMEQFFQLFNPDVKKYLTKFAIGACVFHFLCIALIFGFIIKDIPNPFFPSINGLLPPDAIHKMLMFSAITTMVHLTPSVLLMLALLHDIPLPFMPRPPVKRPPSTAEITSWEQLSAAFGSIRLTRFENAERTIIYANFRDDRSMTEFKLVLCKAKEEGAITDCYLFDEEDQSLDEVTPSPITVNELEEIFSVDHE